MTVEIVAELSGEHLGDYDRMLRLIDAAVRAGADAVKFQCWTKGTMAREPDKLIESGPWAGKTLGALYEACWTPWAWFPHLAAACESLRVPWLSSVCDLGALEFLESVGCPRYKISSFELPDLDLIKAVAETGKPIVMSTGMATEEEISKAFFAATSIPWNSRYHSLTLLHCVSAYPAPPEEMNLATMQATPWKYARAFGLSDHTLGWIVPALATAMGAEMIEKHLTLSRADGGPDSAFASEPLEFAEMVQQVRLAEAIRGKVQFGPKPSEQYVHLRRGPEGRG